MGFLTRCKRPFLFAFLLQFCNMLFSFFLKTFLILFEKQQRLAETPCSVVIRCGTRSADAKSILNVMALAAKCGETVTIEVSGEDEEATLQELREFFTANF